MNINEVTVDDVAALVGIGVGQWRDMPDRPNGRERLYLRDNQRAAIVVRPRPDERFRWAVFYPGDEFSSTFGDSETREAATDAAEENLKKLLARYL